MRGPPDSRDDAASPPMQEPSPGTGSPVAAYAPQLLAIVGGAAGITGVAILVGLLVHTGHLAMLGVPLFPMSSFAYSELALRFFMGTAGISVSDPWLTAGWLAGALGFIAVFAAYPSLREKKWLRTGSIFHRSAHTPVVYPLSLLAIVVGGGLLLRQSTGALSQSSSTALLWPISGDLRMAAEKRLAEKGDLPADWALLGQKAREALEEVGAFGHKPKRALLSGDNIRWCLFHRIPGWPEVRRLEGDESCSARRSLETYYAGLLGGTGLLLLLYIATRYGRRRLTPRPAGQSRHDRSSLLVAAGILLEIPAVMILALLLIALPRDYGALIVESTYPVAIVQRTDTKGDRMHGVLVSPATGDAKSVSVLHLESPGNEYSGYVLEIRSLDPETTIQITTHADILQAAQAQITGGLMAAAEARAP